MFGFWNQQGREGERGMNMIEVLHNICENRKALNCLNRRIRK
jgi:hypothetical protein